MNESGLCVSARLTVTLAWSSFSWNSSMSLPETSSAVSVVFRRSTSSRRLTPKPPAAVASLAAILRSTMDRFVASMSAMASTPRAPALFDDRFNRSTFGWLAVMPATTAMALWSSEFAERSRLVIDGTVSVSRSMMASGRRSSRPVSFTVSGGVSRNSRSGRQLSATRLSVDRNARARRSAAPSEMSLSRTSMRRIV